MRRRSMPQETGSPMVLETFQTSAGRFACGAESSGAEFCFRPIMLSAFMVDQTGGHLRTETSRLHRAKRGDSL